MQHLRSAGPARPRRHPGSWLGLGGTWARSRACGG